MILGGKMIKSIKYNKEFVFKYLDVILLWLIPFLVYVPLGLCIKNGLKENILIPMEAGYVILIIADILIDFYLKHEKISLRDGITMDITRRFIVYIGSYLVVVMFGIEGYSFIPISSLVISQFVAITYNNCKYKINGFVWATVAVIMQIVIVRMCI